MPEKDMQSTAVVGQEARTLASMHQRAFHAWLQLTLEHQRSDFRRFLERAEGGAACLSADRRDALRNLAPDGAQAEEAALFVNDLATILTGSTPLAETREVFWNPASLVEG